MRRWLSSTSRCGLHVFRWPRYTDIYWRVLTFVLEFREFQKKTRSILPTFTEEGGGGPLLENSPSFPTSSSIPPLHTINPFLHFSFLFLSPANWTRFLFFETRGWREWPSNLCFDACILIFKRVGKFVLKQTFYSFVDKLIFQ